ncbi:cation transporter [Acinetobacter courvalinii]|uniref:cation efflux protein, CzcI-like n=1 Tax=Acinetobacter courvalinii TaxID=280147 RepID=UPI0021D37A9E|nr:cation efflux protein, CzcI-like [Acinetobacter courvalinii]MCU4577782.1 cation transporter [Acinetobacter courvalinii]
MQRPLIFMTLLLSLFMFQGFWNVAAAFCAHEKSGQYSELKHFGHHAPEKRHVSATHSASAVEADTDVAASLNLQDHHDHLPSCSYVMVMQTQQQWHGPVVRIHEIEHHYDWSNAYQSPHLSGLNPPPILTSL